MHKRCSLFHLQMLYKIQESINIYGVYHNAEHKGSRKTLLVHKPKVQPFFGPRVSHFLKVEPKIGISEHKGTNRGYSNVQITLANTVISAIIHLPQAVSQMCEEENKPEMEMRMNIFGTFHGILWG